MICPLHQHAMNHPDDPYIIYSDRTITYEDLNRYVTECTEFLKDHPKETPFAIVGSDALNILSWLFAAARSNRILAITSTKDPVDVRDHHLRSLKIDPTSQTWSLPEPITVCDQQPTILEPDAALCILFTSGSSGNPKQWFTRLIPSGLLLSFRRQTSIFNQVIGGCFPCHCGTLVD